MLKIGKAPFVFYISFSFVFACLIQFFSKRLTCQNHHLPTSISMLEELQDFKFGVAQKTISCIPAG
jgi:hypothetical protein